MKITPNEIDEDVMVNGLADDDDLVFLDQLARVSQPGLFTVNVATKEVEARILPDGFVHYCFFR